MIEMKINKSLDLPQSNQTHSVHFEDKINSIQKSNKYPHEKGLALMELSFDYHMKKTHDINISEMEAAMAISSDDPKKSLKIMKDSLGPDVFDKASKIFNDRFNEVPKH